MKPLRIGLTGGIASGKSHISRLFLNKKIDIIDADEIARSLFTISSPLLDNLQHKFGSSIFKNNGELDRKTLGKIVFNSAADLEWLNQLTHPEVTKEISHQLSKVKSAYVILDIPLLIDQSGQIPAHLKSVIDRVLVINVTAKNQIKRLRSRDKISSLEAQTIIDNQSTLAQKLIHADDIIDNNDTLNLLESQVDLLHNHYLKLSKSLNNP